MGRIAVTVPAVGRLGASGGVQTKLAFMNAGHIAAIDVQLGQRVVAGETLARLDTTGFALAANQAQAQARAARAQAQAAAAIAPRRASRSIGVRSRARSTCIRRV